MDIELRTSATLDSIRKKKRIVAMRNKGRLIAEIAAHIGCSRQYVEQVLKRHAGIDSKRSLNINDSYGKSIGK